MTSNIAKPDDFIEVKVADILPETIKISRKVLFPEPVHVKPVEEALIPLHITPENIEKIFEVLPAGQYTFRFIMRVGTGTPENKKNESNEWFIKNKKMQYIHEILRFKANIKENNCIILNLEDSTTLNLDYSKNIREIETKFNYKPETNSIPYMNDFHTKLTSKYYQTNDATRNMHSTILTNAKQIQSDCKTANNESDITSYIRNIVDGVSPSEKLNQVKLRYKFNTQFGDNTTYIAFPGISIMLKEDDLNDVIRSYNVVIRPSYNLRRTRNLKLSSENHIFKNPKQIIRSESASLPNSRTRHKRGGRRRQS